MIEDLYNEHFVDTPNDIEQVIEGGEERVYESGRENENEDEKSGEDKNKETEDNKDKKSKVRRKLGPRMVLNAERLNGPRGIGVMESFFSDLKLHGKGREREDLETVMKRMEHWAHRLAPRLQFDDCLKKIEKLGSKKQVANKVKRIRLDLDLDDDVVRDNGTENVPNSPPPLDDPFDQLVGSAVAAPPNADMTAEQKEQMLRNRLLAEERRAARIQKAQEMKLKFQERLMNSQTLNSESVDLPDQACEVQPENERKVIIGEVEDDLNSLHETETNSNTVDAVLDERLKGTVIEQIEKNVPPEDADFERMLVDIEDNQTDFFVEKCVKSFDANEEKGESFQNRKL